MSSIESGQGAPREVVKDNGPEQRQHMLEIVDAFLTPQLDELAKMPKLNNVKPLASQKGIVAVWVSENFDELKAASGLPDNLGHASLIRLVMERLQELLEQNGQQKNG